jgi:transcriptional regulator
MARANPQWRDFAPDTEVLVIFQGPHAYVSPNWYKTNPAVPTWNYAVAHAYGTPRLIESGEALAALLRDVVSAFDADPELAWLRGASKPRFLEGMMRQVVGFEIPIARMETKAKLSQNRPEADRAAVIEELARSNDTADRGVAEMMRDNDA